jgi:hypothetical protein
MWLAQNARRDYHSRPVISGDILMRKLLFGLAALPFLVSIASARQPLSDQQMDRVIAGFVTGPDALILCSGPCVVQPQPQPTTRTFGAPSITPMGAVIFGGSPTLPQNLFTFSFPL